MITVSVEWLQRIEAALVGLCRDYRNQHGLDGAWNQVLTDGEAAIRAIGREINREPEDVPCNPDPRAPHGFDRNASHSLGRYVCDCEGWIPEPEPEPQPVTQQDIEELWDAIAELREKLQ